MSAAAAVVVLALAELDESHFGQFQISRPIVLGPVVGALLGDWRVGACLGALIELFSLDRPPVGSSTPLNPTVFFGAAALLALRPGAAPLEAAAFPAAILLSLAYRRAELAVRARTAEPEVSGRRVMASLGKRAALSAAFFALVAAVAAPALRAAWPLLPAAAVNVLQLAYVAGAPLVGGGVLLAALRPR